MNGEEDIVEGEFTVAASSELALVPSPIGAQPADPELLETRGVTNLDQRPRIKLPGDGRMIGDLATELGQVLAPSGIYKYRGCAAVYDERDQCLEAIKPGRFRTWIERYVIPFKANEDGEVDQSMSGGDAGAVIISEQFLSHLREVERVNTVRLPVARPDGRVELLPEGYDAGSKILTAPSAVQYETDMPLAEAKSFLDELLDEFPFVDETRAKATSVAAMLTLFGLDLMPPKTVMPVFLYRSNVPGLGKGLLAQAAIIPVLGHAPTGVKPKDETEIRKFLFTMAKEGRPVAFLDNVTGRLASSSLESFITTSTVTGRVLGSSKSLNCRKNSVVFITGNNLTMNPDMARRTLITELFLAGDLADRTIRNHLDENRLLELRPRILAALYALVRVWAESGKPQPATINPNFVVWSQIIGGIVEHGGFGSVTESSASTASADPNAADMVTLTGAMLVERSTEAMTFPDVVAIARKHHLFAALQRGEVPDRAEKTILSRRFASYDQRVFSNGLRFVVIGKGHARRYAVRRVGAMGGEPIAAT